MAPLWPSERACLRRTPTSTNALRKRFIHQGQADRVIGRVQQCVKLVELPEDLQGTGNVVQGKLRGSFTKRITARAVRMLDEAAQAKLKGSAAGYVKNWQRHAAGMKRLG